MTNVPFNIQKFNDKIRAMNQANSKSYTMTAGEARDLHADIFSLLDEIAKLANRLTQTKAENQISISMDGGGFGDK